jgi:hypothetical protein
MKKTSRAKPPLTLGDFITQVYDACEDKAAMVVWFAMKTRLLVFPPRRGPIKRALGAPAPLRAGLRPLLAHSAGQVRARSHRKVPVPVLMLR